jgi:outer membrane protein OmpA-like peptidoglycan-associated protein
MNRSLLVLLAAMLTPSVLGGCATEEPKSPSVGLTEPFHPPQPPDLGRAPGTEEIEGTYRMYVNDSVRSVCSGPDAVFTFDSSKPTLTDQPTMNVLLACMTSGPLRGKTIRLTGYTDPRGTDAHNQVLGLARAERVKRFLVKGGIEASRIETASMGAEGARQAPENWGTDRRVQVDVVP